MFCSSSALVLLHSLVESTISYCIRVHETLVAFNQLSGHKDQLSTQLLIDYRVVQHSYVSLSCLFLKNKHERDLLQSSIFVFTNDVLSFTSATGQHCY